MLQTQKLNNRRGFEQVHQIVLNKKLLLRALELAVEISTCFLCPL